MSVTFVFMMVSVLASGASVADFHVGPGGDDAHPGSADAPFATLDRARDAVRALKERAGLPVGGVTVWIHEGVYPRSGSFTLSDGDGGTAAAPVVYRAAPGERAALMGGVEIPAYAFSGVTDAAAIDRIDPGARTHVVCARLEGLGVDDWGTFPDAFREPPALPELFYNDERMTVARWPNGDWAKIKRIVESGPAPWRQHASDHPGTFEYGGDRPARWLRAPAVWLHGYWCFDWCAETIRVEAIDTNARHITFVQPHGYGLGSGNPGPRRFYATNLLEELDEPGEYYLDSEWAMLYFWPPGPLDDASIALSTLADPVLELDDASFITLQGLTVTACSGTGIEMRGGRACQVAACHVFNTGHTGVVVDGGRDHTVVACDIHDTGTAGLRLSGGDRKTLTPSGHRALNNHLFRVSRRQRTHAYHVHLAGVGILLAHNLMHHGPHQAIGLAGNDHVIEFNEIHHTGMETDDCGAFYMGRNPSERGSVLRHNFWHHIGSTRAHGSCAVYFDDGSGGQIVFGNAFHRAAGGHFGAVFSHGGHDNMVENNVFVECKLALGHAPWTDTRWRDYLDADLWQNNLLKEVDITKPPYTDRYPGLAGFMEFDGGPRHNHAARNVVVDCDAFVRGNWTLTDNWVTDADPGFVDAAAMNFQLREDAPAFKRVPGFKPIPFDEIGLYTDDLRPTLP